MTRRRVAAAGVLMALHRLSAAQARQLLTRAADRMHRPPVGRRRHRAAHWWSAGARHAPSRHRRTLPHSSDVRMTDCHPKAQRGRRATGINRWPPHHCSGVTTSRGLLHGCVTRRGCGVPLAGCPHELSKRCRRRGVATIWVDSCWVRSDHITIPSIHNSPSVGRPASRGGDRSRRHRLPGRFPVRHGRVVPDVLRCHATRSGRAAAIMLGRPDDRTGVSRGSLTIASNSACSHSSSSQTNAQKSASTAPEPSAAPVFSRPSMPLTPSRSSKKPADVCPLV